MLRLTSSMVFSPGEEITDLTGLEEFKNLAELDLTEYELFFGLPPLYVDVTDLSPLAGLTKLISLKIEGSFTTLAPLSLLTELKTLRVYGDGEKSTNINAVYRLSKIEELQLDFLQIRRIEGFANFENLKLLLLTNNLITDIEALSEIASNLTGLYIYGNPINTGATPDCYHKAEKDFTVGLTLYEVWKSNVPARTDLQEATDALSLDDLIFAEGDSADSVTADFQVPVNFLYGTTISWGANNDALAFNPVSGHVRVTRPADSVSVNLTAQVDSEGITQEKILTIQLYGYLNDDLKNAERALTYETFTFTGEDDQNAVTSDFTLPVAFLNGTTITWRHESETLSIDALNGKATLTRPSNTQVVRLFASISKEGRTTGKELPIQLIGTTDEALSRAEADLSAAQILYAAGDSKNRVTQSFTLPLTASQGTTVSWVSDSGNVQINAENGIATFSKTLVDHDETFTATIHKSGRTLSKQIVLRFVAITANDAEAVAADIAGINVLFAEGNSEDYVTKSFNLPITGTHGTTITWSEESEYLSIDALTGKARVAKPMTAGYQSVYYTATARKGSASAQRTFEISIYTELDGDAAVSIQDPLIREMLIDQYDANNDNVLSRQEALSVQTIRSTALWEAFVTKEITSLSGLEYLENLETLDLSYTNPAEGLGGSVSCNVSSLAPLSDLEFLNEIIVTGTFAGLDDLAFLDNLQELSVNSEKPMSMEPLYSLPLLTKLDLINIKLSGLSGIEEMEELEDLSLYANGIKDIEPLSAIAGQLHSLSIQANPLYNSLSPNCIHKEEKDFFVGGTKFEVWVKSDISGAAFLDEVVTFADAGILEKLLFQFDANNNERLERREAYQITELDSFDLVNIGERITDLGGFEELKNLMSLDLRTMELFFGLPPVEVKITDLGPLSGLVNLQTLMVEGSFDSLSALSNLHNLETLVVLGDGTKQTKITGVLGLSNLEQLSLYKLKIASAAGFSALTKLKTLALANNNIRDIEAISDISAGLTSLTITGNPINNASTANAYHKREKDFTVGITTYEVWKDSSPVLEALLYARAELDEETFTYAFGDSKNQVSTNFRVPIAFLQGTTITWDHGSEYMQIDPNTGVVAVTRPTEDQLVTLTAILKKDGLQTVKILSITLKKPSGGGSGSPQNGALTPIVIIDPNPPAGGVLRPIFTAPLGGSQFNQQVNLLPQGGTLTVEFQTEAPIIHGEISADALSYMQDRDAMFEIITQQVVYRLPSREIDLDEIALRMGVDKEDITISIEISQSAPETIEFVQSLANDGTFQLVVDPVDFEIRCQADGQEEYVTRFSSYVQRKIMIPEGIDPMSVTTAVVVNSDGSLSSVPTRIVIEDGVAYALISSMSNSTYALISVKKTFSDTQNEAVLLLAGKMIINGYADGSFQPKKQITRAEFVAMLTKALGLHAIQTSVFKDVTAKHWAKAAIDAAVEYELVRGYGNGTFAPDALITKEEASILMSRSLVFAGKTASALSDEPGLVTREEMAEMIAEMMKQAELI
ncbi:MAG: hypothetical protein EOM59_08395 [Clostridia bacterium]|nr:hypothetical protein [Clostridia bacterium]